MVCGFGRIKHMTAERKGFTWFEPYRKARKVYLGDRRVLRARGQGEVEVTVQTTRGPVKMTMKNVLYVPGLHWNLLSAKATTSLGNRVVFEDNESVIHSGGKKIVCEFKKGLYVVPVVE